MGRHTLTITIASILILLCISGGVFWYWGNSQITDTADGADKTHYAYVLDKDQYTYFKKESEVSPVENQVLGGILSHHFFTEKYISEFFYKLKKQKPSVIVILSPNHFYAGSAPIATSRLPYQTPWGQINPALEIIDALEKDKLVRTDEYIFNREHGISVPVGFLPKTFPDAKIVPIAIKRFVNAKQMASLAKQLDKILPEDALVLASIDFSHHLNIHSTTFHDAVSEAALKSSDFASIYNLEIDSPPSLYAFLEYMKLRNGRLADLIRTNQAEISKNPESEDITSYFFALYDQQRDQASENPSISLTQWPLFESLDHISFNEAFTGPEQNNLRGQQISIIPYTKISRKEIETFSKKLAPFNTRLLISTDSTECADQNDWRTTTPNEHTCIYSQEFGKQMMNIVILDDLDTIDTAQIPSTGNVIIYSLQELHETQVDALFKIGADRVVYFDTFRMLHWHNLKDDKALITPPITSTTHATAALGSLLGQTGSTRPVFALPFITSDDRRLIRADFFAGLKICGKLFQTTDIHLPCKIR